MTTLKTTHAELTRRERQAMDIVYRLGEATAGEIQANLPDPPTYSAVRSLLRVLLDKGHLQYRREGTRYTYRATLDREDARHAALQHVVQTYFDGSAEQALLALLDQSNLQLSRPTLDRLAHLVADTRRPPR